MHITWYVSKENCEKIYKQIIVELGIHKTDIFTNKCYYISYIIFFMYFNILTQWYGTKPNWIMIFDMYELPETTHRNSINIGFDAFGGSIVLLD